MFEKFHALEREKQDRIINAAMKEFAANGFGRASTNAIVKEAGISKGLLFHYFANKKQLFLYLFDYGAALVMEEFARAPAWSEPDLFQRMRLAMQTKLVVWKRHPELFRFMETAYLEMAGEVKPEMEERIKRLYADREPLLFKGLDLSPFRPELDTGKTLQVIVWSVEKLGDYLLENYKPTEAGEPRYEEMAAEAETYLDLLRQAFYTKP
ncbi:TetR/AcrR family transcriptional regulator [Gorillibacterium sp. sgz500922]|uniref:TetR/AcrR family transcriptional regulator n=1 Tax=Gorillibacterium sp. sgz500922 TaxID=3446694 RepID=UPI003F67F9B6